MESKRSSSPMKPGIVFCHGLWADGSCFSKLIVPLQAEGYECIAAQYGLNTTAEDVAAAKETIGRVSGPVILVGHSYGGSVITGAGTDDRVVGLVYIAALAPDADETSQTQQSKFPRTDVFSHIEVADGRIWLRPEGTKYFCGDLSEQEQKLVWAARSVRGESRGNGLEVEAELVHRRQKGLYRSSRSGADLRKTHGRNHLRARQQPRADAFSAKRRARRDPQGRKRLTKHCNGPAGRNGPRECETVQRPAGR